MKKIILLTIIITIGGVAVYYSLNNQTVNDVSDVRQSTKTSKQQLVGTWQSDDDEKSFIMLNEDGSLENVYDKKQVNTGTWDTHTHEEAPGVVYLDTKIDGENLKYTILKVNGLNLSLSYLARGNTLNYTRVDGLTLADGNLPEDWQAYTNEEYGFSLARPETWEVQEALKPQEIKALHEISIHEKEYDIFRAETKVNIFTRSDGETVQEWWNNWLTEEDAKEVDCKKEYGNDSPCLFLRGLVESEEQTTLNGEDAVKVSLFRFDHSEECVYAANGNYIFGVCAPGTNPNDPKEKEHKATTDQILESFQFTN